MTKLNRKHGIEVGSKVKVISAEGSSAYRNLVGDIVTVDKIFVADDSRYDIIYAGGSESGQHPSRYELIPDVPTLKVGDKVRVVRKVESYDVHGMGHGIMWRAKWPSDMDSAIGREFTVDSVDSVKSGNGVTLRHNNWNYNFPLSALELVETFAPNGVDADGNPLYFKDEDLKPFQRAVLRDGRTVIVSVDGGGTLAFTYESRTWSKAAIVAVNDSKYDVMEVYEPPFSPGRALNFTEKGKLLWKADAAFKQEAIKVADKVVEEARAALVAAEAARTALN